MDDENKPVISALYTIDKEKLSKFEIAKNYLNDLALKYEEMGGRIVGDTTDESESDGSSVSHAIIIPSVYFEKEQLYEVKDVVDNVDHLSVFPISGGIGVEIGVENIRKLNTHTKHK